MASHHAKDGIRVNCVCPGMLYTPMMYGSGMSEARRKARRERSLLKTEGNGWDCGAAVRFLASDEARYVGSSLAIWPSNLSRWITGSMLTVDAGTSSTAGIVANSNL